MIEEIWVQVHGYEGYYKVSSLGRVFSEDRIVKSKHKNGRKVVSKEKSQQLSREGYLYVNIFRGGDHKPKRVAVHRLVAMSFMSCPNPTYNVNHKNGVKTDNRLCNLEWTSRSENQIHAIKMGLYKSVQGESCGQAVLKEDQVLEIRKLGEQGMMHKDIALIFGVGRKAITKILNRQRWKHI